MSSTSSQESGEEDFEIILEGEDINFDNIGQPLVDKDNNEGVVMKTKCCKSRCCNDKGFWSNFITFLIMVVGLFFILTRANNVYYDTIGQFIFSFGLFGFSGGITNWLAVKMLFDRIPFLIGSGVILNHFTEIKVAVKNVIMDVFFDSDFLGKYISRKTSQIIGNLKLEDKINKIFESSFVDEIIATKLKELNDRPEGMWLTMMGITGSQLKPMIKPFVVGMISDTLPMVITHIEKKGPVSIKKLRIEIECLLTTKLEEISADTVKNLLERVIRDHLGWIIVWGNIFGGVVGILTKIVELVSNVDVL